MRAVAIPLILAGTVVTWACLARFNHGASEATVSPKLAAPIVISIPADSPEGEASADSVQGGDVPILEQGFRADCEEYIRLQRAEVAAISMQLEQAREESSRIINDLTTRRQTDATFMAIRSAELKAAQSQTDRRFEEWQDRDLELQHAIEDFQQLSTSLSAHQQDPRAAALVIGKSAMNCLAASELYQEAGMRWSEAVQAECLLCSTNGRRRPMRAESDADIDPTQMTQQSAAIVGQQAMRFADSGKKKMESHQARVQFIRRMRPLKVVGPLHQVDSLSAANHKLYSEVRQVANSLTRDPEISSERLAFLRHKLDTLKLEIERNNSVLNAASKNVTVHYRCSSGRCSQ